MGLNFGAFAGGLASGYTQGVKNQALIDESMRRKKEQDTLDAKNAEIAQFLNNYDNPAEPPSAPATTAPPPTGIGAPPPGTQSAQAAPSAEGQAQVSASQTKRPRTMGDTLEMARGVAEIKMRHGDDIGEYYVGLSKMIKQVEDEGGKQGLMEIHAGNFDKALETMNSSGSNRGVRYGTQPHKETVMINGRPQETYVGTIIDSKGRETPFNTMKDMYAMMDAETQVEMNLEAEQKQYDRGQDRERLGIARVAANKPSDFDSKAAWIEAMVKNNELTQEEGKAAILNISGGTRGASEAAQMALVLKQDAVEREKQNTRNTIEQKRAALMDEFGGVTEQNIAEINALTKALGEPPFVAVTTPGKKHFIGPDGADTVAYVQKNGIGSGNGQQQGESEGQADQDEEKKVQGPVPPVNERVAGKTTTTINGQDLVWNGKGWVVIK